MPTEPPRAPERDLLRPYSIGVKLKTLRAAKGLTLAHLRAETGYSAGLLSKLESDHMIPTLLTLVRICRVYGVNLSYFFSDVQHHSLAITRQAQLSTQSRQHPAVRRTLLHLPSAEGKQLSQIVDIPAGATLNVNESGGRTELTAYVLEGTLHISTGLTKEVLHVGDCIVLDSEETLLLSAPECLCRVLSVRAR
jgi:transcriptional regulator with XRE-family HTH domain